MAERNSEDKMDKVKEQNEIKNSKRRASYSNMPKEKKEELLTKKREEYQCKKNRKLLLGNSNVNIDDSNGRASNVVDISNEMCTITRSHITQINEGAGGSNFHQVSEQQDVRNEMCTITRSHITQIDEGAGGSNFHQVSEQQDVRNGQKIDEIKDSRLCTISSLNQISKDWVLKCQVLQIGNTHFYNNKSGFGSVKKIILVDEEGARIQAIMFNETIKFFEEILEKDHSYFLSNGNVREAVAKYNSGSTNNEIILDKMSTFVKINDFNFKQPIKFNFVPLKSLGDYADTTILIDIIAMVISIGEPIAITRKSDGEEVVRRDVTIIDHSWSFTVQLTLWANLATNEGDIIKKVLDERPILIATSLRAQNFKGISLSTTTSTILKVNPGTIEAIDLKNRIKNSDNEVNILVNGSSEINLLRNKYEKITIQELLANLNCATKQVWQIEVKVEELNKRQDPWYIACKICGRKTMELDGIIKCKKCVNSKIFVDYRFMLRVKVGDHTGSIWVTLFNKEVEKLLNCKVDELREIKDLNIHQFLQKIENCLGRRYLLTLKVAEIKKEDLVNYNYTGISIENIDNTDQKKENHFIQENAQDLEDSIEEDEDAEDVNLSKPIISLLRKRKVIIDDKDE